MQDAFDRLIELVKRLDGDDRERVRERLLELFTVVGAADPRVADGPPRPGHGALLAGDLQP